MHLDWFDICPTITATATTGVPDRRFRVALFMFTVLAFEDGLLILCPQVGKQQPSIPIRTKMLNND